MFFKGFILVFIRLSVVFSCDDSVSDITDTSLVSGEYQNVFKAIPSFFEYLMNLIEEKPNILEKDDITVFTREAKDGKTESVAEVGSVESVGSDEEYDYDVYPGSDFWEWYVGATDTVASLSSEEVAEKTLKIEKELEDYNSSKGDQL